MPSTYRGKLEAFLGSWGSGLGFLIIDGTPIPCESGPALRTLDACFGSVVAYDHRVSSRSFQGREVVFSLDDFGILLGFTPVEKWNGPEIPPQGLVVKLPGIHSRIRIPVQQRDVPYNEVRHFKGREREVRLREKVWNSWRGKIIEVEASTCEVSAVCGKLCWELAPGPLKDEADQLFGSHPWTVCECQVEPVKN